MKLLHVSDLHIGKKLKGFSLLEDQEYILSQIIDIIEKEKVKGIIIAGDIYDTSIPQVDAVNIFDKFLSKLFDKKISVYAVSGNHDSVSRLSFGSHIFQKGDIHISQKYNGKLTPIEIDKDINIWLLPFIRPFEVREYHSKFETSNYDEMMKIVLDNIQIDDKKINILVAHQFITNSGKTPERSDSETSSLGTLDNIDYKNFDKFDYVALGHIHKPQTMGRKEVRYSGSPLKYSFSEKNDNKSVVLLDISKGKVDFELIPLTPMRDLKEFVGHFNDLVKLDKCNDFSRIILQDENYITDVKHKLEEIFPNVMEIVYDNTYSKENKELYLQETIENKSPIELFKEFYFIQNNKELDEEQLKIINNIFVELDMEEV